MKNTIFNMFLLQFLLYKFIIEMHIPVTKKGPMTMTSYRTARMPTEDGHLFKATQ